MSTLKGEQMDDNELNLLLQYNPDLRRRNPLVVIEESAPVSKEAWTLLGKPKRRHGKPEELFQQQIIDLAQQNGWRVAHFRTVRIQRKDGSVYYATPVQADGEGFLDLILLRGSEFVVAEVKANGGRMTEAQKEWFGAWKTAGAEVYTWYPQDWETIEERLKR